LTVRDAFSRYVLACELVPSTDTASARKVFEELFEAFGLPRAIRVDNGTPFASMKSPGGLTRLSAWWVSIGIEFRRGRPAHPEDNGGHERMHLEIARELEDVPADNLERQQAALRRWRVDFNEVRPHEALGMRTPSDTYRRSQRRLGPPRIACYPRDFVVRAVNCKGSIKFQGRQVYVSLALAGHDVGVQAGEDGTVRLRFYDLDLGTIGSAA
jgi:transposase InsO family protein